MNSNKLMLQLDRNGAGQRDVPHTAGGNRLSKKGRAKASNWHKVKVRAEASQAQKAADAKRRAAYRASAKK